MRRLPTFAIGLLLLVILVERWTARGAEADSAAAAAEHAEGPGPRAATVGAMPTGPGDEGADPERLASQRCFGDLMAFDGMSGFDGVRAALAAGLPSDDPLLGDYLRDLIAERIGESAERALEVLSWAEGAHAADAQLLLEGLARSKGALDLRVASRLVELGARAGLDEQVRAAALDAVRVQPALEPADRTRLAALALDEAVPATAWHATRALGGVMVERERLGGDTGPYWDELARVAAQSDDAAVRALALEAPMHADSILPKEKIATLLALFPNEPHRDVRELAIFQLGLTDSPTDALEAMRQAFDGEYDECVRWAIVRFSVRAAGERSLPLLEHFARIDPAFEQDLADFRELFAAGFQDFEKIWLHKAERHACAVENGEPHGAL